MLIKSYVTPFILIVLGAIKCDARREKWVFNYLESNRRPPRGARFVVGFVNRRLPPSSFRFAERGTDILPVPSEPWMHFLECPFIRQDAHSSGVGTVRPHTVWVPGKGVNSVCVRARVRRGVAAPN